MMSPNREDYIKTIFNQNEKNIKLNNKRLAELLNVSPASTSEMIRKLIESGHVERDSKKGLTLTTKGREEAETLVQKHRLWEVFLVEHLGYSWTEVHDDAEILEHSTSDKLAKRLNQFLEFPETCPHGEIIYGNVSSYDDDTVAMHELKIGDKAKIVRVRDTAELLEYLERIQLNLEDIFVIKDKLPYEGPYVLDVDGVEIEVSERSSHDIYVQPVKD